MNTDEYITIEEEIPERKEVTKNSFSEFFNEKLERLNSVSGKAASGSAGLKKRDIADMIGVSYEVFRKYINKEKPTERRDCIIAVCAVLGATAGETNDGLYYYGMDELTKGWKRDEALIELIGSDERPRTVDEINDGLIERGFDELDIIHHKGRKKPAGKKTEYPYKLIRKKVEIPVCDFTDNALHFVPVDKIRSFSVRTIMEFSDNGDPVIIWVDTWTDGDEPEIFHMLNIRDHRQDRCQKYTGPELTGEFRECFEELMKTGEAEIKKLCLYYNDTGNFRYLSSARVIDNELHFFIEIYNHDLILIDEYYLMDYCDGEMRMTVSPKSRFLRLYLTEDEYETRFPNTTDDIIAEYTTDPEYSDDLMTSDKLLSVRSEYYNDLKNRIGEMLEALYNNELYIGGCHFPTDKDNIYSIIDDYGEDTNRLCEAFDCIYERRTSSEFSQSIPDDVSELDSDDLLRFSCSPMVNGTNTSTGYYNRIIGVRNESHEFTLSGGETAELTIQDLIDGKNLGLKTVDEVGYFKLEHGVLDLKEIVYNDDHCAVYDSTRSEDMNKNSIFYDYVVIDEKIEALNEKISELQKQGLTEDQLGDKYIELGRAIIEKDMIIKRINKCLDRKGRKDFKEFMALYEERKKLIRRRSLMEKWIKEAEASGSHAEN